MNTLDLRDSLDKADGLGKLVRIEGADWDRETGAITGLNVKLKFPVPKWNELGIVLSVCNSLAT